MRSSETYLELLNYLRGRFTPQPDKIEETPESTLDALWLLMQGRPCSARTAPSQELEALGPEEIVKLRALIELRLSATPLAHLTRRQHFMGLELLAGPDALVPRIETEILARAAIGIADSQRSEVVTPRFLDVCTGSGNVALAMAMRIPAAKVGACDLSEGAIALARSNASHVHLADRVEFRVGDLLAPFRDIEWAGHVDLLTCNPPYISSAKVAGMADEIADHEPSMAFDGGPFGVSILMRLVQEAPDVLRPGGWCAFEVGLGQGPAMEKRLKAGGRYRVIQSHQDSNGQVRAISAQRG